ncbi:ABC transporter permease [Ornithinimicrobium sp. INDO-MA30-4]|uniref:ABC transporter permease n=1 Tax=Ornithinimicrobium sp. INDO-MA30-4 TaxID=2908651 RepID=UPI0021A93B74|nr:ABC transporter permease [Ornithinimicrobium sp. INDO-MA30-4]
MSVDTPTKPTAPAETAPRPNMMARVGSALGAQAMQIVLVWLAIIAIFAVLSPDAFFDPNNFRNIAISVSILAVLGVGTTFIIITGGIDLSMGSVLVFSGVVSSMAMGNVGEGQGWLSALVGIIVALTSGLAWGTLNGFLVAKAKVPAMIVTLGTFGAALGLAKCSPAASTGATCPTCWSTPLASVMSSASQPW